jgi:hypothetical protein
MPQRPARLGLSWARIVTIASLAVLTGCASASAPPAPIPDNADLLARLAALEREVADLRALSAAKPAGTPVASGASGPAKIVRPAAPSADVVCEAGTTALPRDGSEASLRTCFDANGLMHGPLVVMSSERSSATVLLRAHFRAGVAHGPYWYAGASKGGFTTGQFLAGKAVGTWIEPVRLVQGPTVSFGSERRGWQPDRGEDEPWPFSSPPAWKVTQPGVAPSDTNNALAVWVEFLALARRADEAVPLDTKNRKNVVGNTLVTFFKNVDIDHNVVNSAHNIPWLGKGEYSDGQRTGVWHLREKKGRRPKKGTEVVYDMFATVTFRDGKPVGEATLTVSDFLMILHFDTDGRPTGTWNMGAGYVSFKDGLLAEIKTYEGKTSLRLQVVDGQYEGAVSLPRYGVTGTLADGHPVGTWVTTRGLKTRTYRFDDQGRLDGPWSGEFKDVDRAANGHYCHGKRCGVWSQYAGKTLVDQFELKDDALEGSAKHWSESGRLMQTTIYRKGIRHGAAEKRDGDGTVVFKGAYQKGAKHGAWSETGRWDKPESGSYRDGKRHGAWTACPEDIEWIDDCGSVRYVAGALDGPVTFISGNLRTETRIRTSNGNRPVADGSYAVYRDDVRIQHGTLDMGQQVGEWVERYYGGKIRKRFQCRKGSTQKGPDCRVTEKRDTSGTLRFSSKKTRVRGLFRDRYWDEEGTLTGDLIVNAKDEPCGAYMRVSYRDDSTVVGKHTPAETGESCVEDGRFTETSADGAVEVRHFKAGQRTGRWEWRDSSGNVTRWVEYEQGSEARRGP